MCIVKDPTQYLSLKQAQIIGHQMTTSADDITVAYVYCWPPDVGLSIYAVIASEVVTPS